MLHQVVEGLLLSVLEEARVLFRELVDHLGQEIEGVVLVLGVFISAADDLDDFLHDIGLCQNLEEAFVLAEIDQNGACVQSHMKVVLVSVGNFIQKGSHNHDTLFLEDLLHLFLGGGQLRLVGLLLDDVEVAVV